MKVKIINSIFDDELEDKINDFINNKKIIDIKYSDFSALIMYEE